MKALVILVINVFAPGVGTIISAFLGAECENITVYVGVAQALTTPLFGLGFFWSIIWSVKLVKDSKSSSDEENPLIADDAPPDEE